MKKSKIGDIILWLVVIVVILNTIVAYVSYKMVCDDKKPLVTLDKKETSENVIYKEGLYKIIVTENDKMKEVSLKLFFLK